MNDANRRYRHPLAPPTVTELRTLLEKHHITRESAAEKIHATLYQMQHWCLPESSRQHRPMPLAYWELLLIKLGEIDP